MKKILLYICIALIGAQLNAQQSSTDMVEIQRKINEFAVIDLKYDLRKLRPHEMYIVPHLLRAAEIADSIFWMQTYGDKNALMQRLENDTLKRFAEINYGPWERLNNNKPFVEGFPEKPKGARFYPADITNEEFDQFKDSNKSSLYSIVKRDPQGRLYTSDYNEAYQSYVSGIKDYLQAAAKGVGRQDSFFGVYLWERGESMVNNTYTYSDKLWMNSQNNILDIIIGPIETYEDQFKGIKTAYETYIVAKDTAWSKKLQRFVKLLPKLQEGLPIEKKYRTALPGLKSQIGAYDVLFYSGDCNSGSKTIAVNLPNDESVQAEYGTRRLQFKNVMKAKFDSILVPISKVLIDSTQRDYINFNAFFSNTMFHEVAHGLGIKNTITTGEPVSKALQQYYSALEEGKADVLGLYMITELLESGDIKVGSIEEYYTTFVASIFRSVRFGAASAHGKANMVRFNYFLEQGAISKNVSGTYTINYEKMKKAVYQLSSIILKIQGDGDIIAAEQLLNTKGVISESLQNDLNRLKDFSIPVDIIFNQGGKYLMDYTQALKNAERRRK
ncbi:Zn-dependent hydrolase [Bacteroidia bacterium]|nr:Zn-dependent hydrolase [Bacteroidia bacterium]